MSLWNRLTGAAAPAATPPAGAAAGAAPTDQGHMPLDQVSAEQVRAGRHGNPLAVWSLRDKAAHQADQTLACHRLRAEFPQIGLQPKFRIDAAEPVFAMGSCFAREVEDALVEQGFDVPTSCDPLFETHALLSAGKAVNQMARPRSYLNRYNTMSMLTEFRHLLGRAPDIESGAIAYEIDASAAADLHYSQSLPQVPRAGVIERRRIVREHLARELGRCRVFVLTLGLAEAWFDRRSGHHLNNTPGPRVLAKHGAALSVQLSGFAQNLAALQALHGELKACVPDGFKLVITVSPVPLERTFLAGDVVVMNHYAKAMLRAVAQEFAARHPDVDYFPSFEMVAYAEHTRAWEWDGRHVKPRMVAHIMSAFRQHYVDGAG